VSEAIGERTRVALPQDELPPGTCTIVTVGRREVAVLNDDGRLYAVFNRCPHQQAPLARGRVTRMPVAGAVGELRFDPDAKVVRCPWHHYEFDLDTGRCVADPARFRIATYEIKVEGDEIALYV
jgi:nitrite reductase/ring-hydroxylating ferredoxin subunit